MGGKREPRIIDYGESTYKRDFWGEGREYEDRAERFALRRLIPTQGARVLEIGAGFGRLVSLYRHFREVVLLDYSEDQLRDARRTWGDDGIQYVAANWYHMPFADASFDAILTVRVLHHAEDLPALMDEIARILAPAGIYVLEFANKRNLKAIARYLLGRQKWSPFDLTPVEYHPLHWDFHPRWMHALLRDRGFSVERRLSVSHFRAALLKRLVPASVLARADAALQWTGRYFQLTPSVFLRARGAGSPTPPPERLAFRCPTCGATPVPAEGGLRCDPCGVLYPLQDGVWMFKTPQPLGRT